MDTTNDRTHIVVLCSSVVFPVTPKYTQQKYYKLIMKPLYTEVFTLKISSTQKRTLEKLKSRNIKVSDFVRKAISEKIQRDYAELQDKPKKEYCPF